MMTSVLTILKTPGVEEVREVGSHITPSKLRSKATADVAGRVGDFRVTFGESIVRYGLSHLLH